MTFEEKWKNIMISTNTIDRDYITRSYSEKWNQSGIRSYLISNSKTFAINGIINGRSDSRKLRFSIAAMLSEYCFIKYNNNWPRWDMKPYTYALLSDHAALIDRFAHLPLDDHQIFNDEKNEVPAFWNYLLQGLLTDDNAVIEKTLTVLSDRINRKKEVSISRAHLLSVEGIMNSNEEMVLNGLKEFELKRNKSRFLKNDICENIISFFPIAYAKIAWLKGIEVDPESDYMPVELLEVKPLKEYTIPYWFLRDYYREEGVDWRYDPIHPELQNWENDPENPDQNKGGFLGNLMNLFG